MASAPKTVAMECFLLYLIITTFAYVTPKINDIAIPENDSTKSNLRNKKLITRLQNLPNSNSLNSPALCNDEVKGHSVASDMTGKINHGDKRSKLRRQNFRQAAELIRPISWRISRTEDENPSTEAASEPADSLGLGSHSYGSQSSDGDQKDPISTLTFKSSRSHFKANQSKFDHSLVHGKRKRTRLPRAARLPRPLNDQQNNIESYPSHLAHQSQSNYAQSRGSSTPAAEALAVLTQKLSRMENDMARLKEAIFLQGAVHIKTSERLETLLIAQGQLALRNDDTARKIWSTLSRCCKCSSGEGSDVSQEGRMMRTSLSGSRSGRQKFDHGDRRNNTRGHRDRGGGDDPDTLSEGQDASDQPDRGSDVTGQSRDRKKKNNHNKADSISNKHSDGNRNKRTPRYADKSESAQEGSLDLISATVPYVQKKSDSETYVFTADTTSSVNDTEEHRYKEKVNGISAKKSFALAEGTLNIRDSDVSDRILSTSPISTSTEYHNRRELTTASTEISADAHSARRAPLEIKEQPSSFVYEGITGTRVSDQVPPTVSSDKISVRNLQPLPGISTTERRLPTTSTILTGVARYFTVDLSTGEIQNNDLPGVTWLEHPTWPTDDTHSRRWGSSSATRSSNKHCSLQGVLKLTFTPPTKQENHRLSRRRHHRRHWQRNNSYSGGSSDDEGPGGRRKLQLELEFRRPKGWVFNLGDSVANNGFSGDGSIQENDGEVQVYQTSFAAYGSDKHPNGRQKLLRLINNFIIDNVTLIVSDQTLQWNNHRGNEATLEHPSLFALSGQADKQGEVNYDVYLGLNRVVGGNYRQGHGLCRLSARWLGH